MFIFYSAALSGVFALRTFAIYGRNWTILVLLGILAAINVVISTETILNSCGITASHYDSYSVHGILCIGHKS
ncbi:hypothetical protein BDP27DRAFT_439496 [Rhodocollybia butyracea]|uniref:Uncharacterized protein n=1 Tax=Rhodocollybia butyracea TaxID=206335 RepID=A0A9P5UBE7_9AGAR|nr:hypothetical protein BDP27DRAFT_439496 [Rhodocollybia butyracea]